MGHACVNVQHSYWKEPVITWIALVISTGNYDYKYLRRF